MRSFRDFMEAALYSPHDGYYQTRTKNQDFFTAPELHPEFASILARECVRRFESLSTGGASEPYFLVEMGSGSGVLASSICRELKRHYPSWASRICYILVERCESLLVQGTFSVGLIGVKTLGYSRLADVPRFTGVFLSNELVDAFAVHVLEKRYGRIWEVYVEGGPDDCREHLGDLSSPDLEPYASAVAPHIEEGGRHAVNLEALAWIKQASLKLNAGFVITVDYGKRFPPQAPNPPRAFYRHTLGDALTAHAGRQDLTSSVNFEELIQEGSRCGLDLEYYDTMGRFLVDRGILDRMPEFSSPEDKGTYQERNRIKTLIHPDGMGEAFKVLIQKKTP